MIAAQQTKFGIRSVEDLGMCPEIGSSEVHIWRADLDAFAMTLSADDFLAQDERKRAMQFHFERDRRRFRAARQILRLLLSRYLEVDAGELEFQYSAHGKPELRGRQADSEVTFNVSHSDSSAFFAFTLSRAVGIDVEQLRADIEVCEIAKRFFSESEQAALRGLAEHLQHQAFFACWTRKEAFVKAKGEGLSLPLHQFDVSLTPGQPAEILGTRPDAEERHRWSLWDLDAGSGYAAALVVEGNDVRPALQYVEA